MKRSVGLFVLATVLVSALAGCRPEARPSKNPDAAVEVLIFGLDGASFELIEPMMARGALPNLKSLIDEGVSAPMRSDLPCLSIVLWTSIATGKRPEAHGITDWSHVDPESGEKSLMSSLRRRVEALWNVATSYERSVGFISWWASWPAEPVNGYMVSEQFTRLEDGETLPRGTFPEDLAQELSTALRGTEWPWLREELEAGRLKLLSDRDGAGSAVETEERYQLAWFLYGQDYQSERALFHLLRHRSHPALVGYLSRKIDVASHYMWQFAPGAESDPRPDNETISRLLEPVYRYEDDLLGRVLAALGPETNVVVLSDHGFGWERDGFGHEETAPEGIFIAHGPAFARGKRIPAVRLYDAAPIVLHALGLPVARDFDGALPDGLFPPGSAAPAYVDTFESEGGRATGEASSPLEQRILEELRALGYVP